MASKYVVGDEVQSVSDPSLIGTVVEICEFHNGLQYYRVNFGQAGRPKKAEIDLRPYVPNPSPSYNLLNGRIDSYEEFQRLITYHRIIRDEPLDNNIYAFNASRTRFYPYQFKPLMKLLDSPKHRLLIADEVGLGKTIEAGLILTELRARQTIQRVLVVCPSNLTEKWRLELKKRFGEMFTVLSAKELQSYLKEYEDSPDSASLNAIISLESIRQQRILDRLEELAPHFNVVIVDEAHHMRNFGRKQRQAGVLLSRSTDAMLLLTATPVHLGNENLFSLLNILDDEDFPNYPAVDERFRDNEPIVKAQICLGRIPPNIVDAVEFTRLVSSSVWLKGNPLMKEVLEKLATLSALPAANDEAAARSLLLSAQKDLADLNLISHIFTRTKKRDVATNMAVRRAFPIRLKMTDIERVFYSAVTDYVRFQAEQNVNCPLILSWMLMMPQRRMASSIPAMVEYYKKKVGFSEEDITEDWSATEYNLPGEAKVATTLQEAERNLRGILARWPEDGPDSKYDSFVAILRNIRSEESRLKVMVFAFFKDTLNYLHSRLTEDGFNSRIIYGDVKPAERIKIVDDFREKQEIEILLSSRVGSEGLDFQFCNVLFNYDLPWNPMEVEQRIGRLDRIGQESPVIRIFNFWIEGTIEQRILERLYERINIFEKSIGELELILGEELGNIERELLGRRLTREEEDKILEIKAQVIEKRAAELKKLENEAAQFIGTDQYFDEEVQRIKSHRRYITGEQMRRYIVNFLRTECPRARLEYDRENNIGHIFPDDRLKSVLAKYGGLNDSVRYLSTARQGIPITFDSQAAFDNPRIDFINVLHVLTQSITEYYEDKGSLGSNAHHVVLRTNVMAPGHYVYFIFKLKVRAARTINRLEIVIVDNNISIACDDEAAEIILGEMVEVGESSLTSSLEVNRMDVETACRKSEAIFQERISRIRDDITRNNEAFVNRRLESLRLSYGKSIKLRQELLDRAVKEKKQDRYLRMLEGTIRRLEAEYEEKKRGLETQRIVEVSYDDIAAGILEVAAG